ncbi:MAG TPA: hypothetical protein VFU09_05385 [Candidatus Udaeobacter sp.]|nr:hypothetical protein [Candidatus Udaeobacter sp.]
MKKLNIRFATILLVLGCFTLSSAVKAVEGAPGIVGLWHEYYTSNFVPPFETYSQWHSDGLEIESPSFSPGQCQGTWKQIGARTYQLFHVGWLPGGGPNGSVRFELRELNTVSVDRNSFDGTYDQKFFDTDGNLVAEDTGTLHATRLSVDQFVDQSNTTAIK